MSSHRPLPIGPVFIEPRSKSTIYSFGTSTVESGKMTKDLAILVGPEQPWMTTEQFFEAIRANLEAAMAQAASEPARA